MKKFIICAFMFAFGNFFLFPQENQNNIQFEESNVEIERPPYFGLGGGYVGNFMFMNLDDINSLTKELVMSEIKSPLFLSGAQGFTAVGIVKNLRIGFSGYSGSKKTEKVENFTTKGLKLEVNYTSFLIDYGIILFKSFAVLPGLNLGWSKITLEKYAITDFKWEDLKAESYTSNNINGSFWFVQPNINFEFAATPFLMLRIGFGYPISFSPKWKINDLKEVSGVPQGLKPTGFNFNFGLFVGLFNY
ncbi:MAG: hypothetical protein ACP5RR_08880 [Candidatus Kapaibacteriota bacterium]